jgi:hypothetical protein
MKKLLSILVLSLLLSCSAYAEILTLNCSFEKYVDRTNFLDEKIIPKNQLSTVITDDKFITLEIKSNKDIKILETSIMMGYEMRKPEDRIITPYKINDNFIHFKEKATSLENYSLDRRTGLLLLNYKSSKQELKIYHLCVKKDKLF